MASNTTSYYNLDQISFSFAGIIITGDFGEGAALSVKRNTELFENTTGRSGDVVRSRTNDKMGTIEVTFLQTSAYNALFNAVVELDNATPNGAGVGALQIKDRENGDIYSSPKAWIQILPETELNRKASDRTWTIACNPLTFKPGGRA